MYRALCIQSEAKDDDNNISNRKFKSRNIQSIPTYNYVFGNIVKLLSQKCLRQFYSSSLSQLLLKGIQFFIRNIAIVQNRLEIAIFCARFNFKSKEHTLPMGFYQPRHLHIFLMFAEVEPNFSGKSFRFGENRPFQIVELIWKNCDYLNFVQYLRLFAFPTNICTYILR